MNIEDAKEQVFRENHAYLGIQRVYHLMINKLLIFMELLEAITSAGILMD